MVCVTLSVSRASFKREWHKSEVRVPMLSNNKVVTLLNCWLVEQSNDKLPFSLSPSIAVIAVIALDSETILTSLRSFKVSVFNSTNNWTILQVEINNKQHFSASWNNVILLLWWRWRNFLKSSGLASAKIFSAFSKTVPSLQNCFALERESSRATSASCGSVDESQMKESSIVNCFRKSCVSLCNSFTRSLICKRQRAMVSSFLDINP